MKTILLACLLLPAVLFGQIDSIKTYDTLGKYSYLLLGMAPPMRPTPGVALAQTGVSTGFFIRHNNRLYLASAFHVFSSCDVYHARMMNLISPVLAVIYKDTLGTLKYILFPLINYITKPCRIFLEYPDFDLMDVSAYFKDARINSVEGFFPDPLRRKKRSKSIDYNKFICYGYEGNKFTDYVNRLHTIDCQPFGFLNNHADSTQCDPYYKAHNIDSFYITTKPANWPGTSGSPIFKVLLDKRKKPFIEFAGVQSGMNTFYNCSYIVKGEEVLKILNQLK